MYIPRHDREDDQTTLHAFMQQYPFATIVTQLAGRLVASHVPLTFDPDLGTHGTLSGHFALGNQQWRSFDGSQEALVLFQEPHTYISASWYEDALHSVPTWNYAVVHAYGVPQKIDRETLLAHLRVLVQMFESPTEPNWSIERSNEIVERLLPGIVGFAIPITQLDGKYKLSQGRSRNDQRRVIEALEDLDNPLACPVAELMQTRLQKKES